jgi:hypothetical protein
VDAFRSRHEVAVDDARRPDSIAKARAAHAGASPGRGRRAPASLLIAIGLLAGCASPPTAPSVMVLPGQDKTFEQFQADDASCRRSAAQAVQAVGDSNIPGQYRFDVAYMQCMYANGHQVPGSSGRSGYTAPPASIPRDVPPPPVGTPPATPPGSTR